MKKIVVNKDACIGCGACIAIDPEHFNFDENGLSEVINQENTESMEVKNAMESCPTNAISYGEEEIDLDQEVQSEIENSELSVA